ncbi:hypothetical protein ONZ43_g6833 [Nemania bipapillata]|uniref:Uncharacterized protein n=1 Tax=Nemania bipapillata TaxID=110536 RepID=A0ACC2HVM0_9PEZI|nr:hypothetical protein ONZ43_g6833 [Nemania bipapillata]
MSCPTEDDIDALAEVYYDSFAEDPNNTWWWPQDRDAMFEWLHGRIRGKMANRNIRHYQVLDRQGGEVVAFARWDIPKGYEAMFGEWIGSKGDDALDVSRVVVDSEQQSDTTEPTATTAPVEEAAPSAVKTIAAPRGADPELCQFFFAKLAALSKKWNADQMLGLSLLCTSPKYYRRGAAKALLAPMLAIADAAGLRSYLEATPAGRPVYEKLGFRVVEVQKFDPDAFTGGKVKGLTTLSIMIREPQPLS